VDRPFQPLPKTGLRLALGKVSHVPPSVPRADAVEPEPTVGFRLDIHGGILPDDRRISGGIAEHLPGV